MDGAGTPMHPDAPAGKSGNKLLLGLCGCCLFIMLAGSVAAYVLAQKAKGFALNLAATGQKDVKQALDASADAFRKLLIKDGKLPK